MRDLNSPSKLSVIYRSTSDLKPDPRNARTHPKEQIKQLKSAIEAFGFTNPILIDERCGVIAGHGRLRAAKELGLIELPTITLTGLSEAEIRALRIADNKIALNAGWNMDLLAIELGEIAAVDVEFDLTLTGFATGELDVILRDPAVEDEPTIPEPAATPNTRPGDIWQLGRHRIGCGDCRDQDFLRRVIGDETKIDMAFMDPPYNVRINGHANTSRRHREFAMASGEMTQDAFQDFLRSSLIAASSVSREGAVHFVCMDWRHMSDVQVVGDDVYGALLNLCIWNKSNAGMGSLYRSKHELIFVYRVGTAPHQNMVELGKNGRNRSNVWDYASVNATPGGRQSDLALHPTVKPIGMVADAICDVTKRGDRVLDLFLGSGTSLLATERMDRQFFGTEIDPAYVDLAIERWETMTGQTAQRVQTEVSQ